jgi:hypothetical protein
MAGDLGFLISPGAIGALAEGAGYPIAYAFASLPVLAVIPLALRLPAWSRGQVPDAEAEKPVDPIG